MQRRNGRWSMQVRPDEFTVLTQAAALAAGRQQVTRAAQLVLRS